MGKLPDHYQLAEEHPKHFVIHDSRDGKRFTVAKKDLHPAHQIHIMKLQKFNEGEPDVEPVEEGRHGASDKYTPDLSDKEGYSKEVEEAKKEAEAADKYQEERSAPLGGYQQSPIEQLIGGNITPAPSGASGSWTPAPANFGQATPPQPPTLAEQSQGLTRSEQAAIEQKGELQQKAGAQEAANYSPVIALAKKNATEAQDDVAGEMTAWNNLFNSAMKPENDVHSFYHDMGTGQRIGLALSIALGGIGAGLTHGPNMALETINKAIDNDLRAQEANLGKKNSLLSLYLQKYRDKTMARTAASGAMTALANAQNAQTQAKFGGQINNLEAQRLSAQLGQQSLMTGVQLNQMELQKKMREHLMNGDVQGHDPAEYVPYVVPEQRQKEVFEEIKDAQNISSLTPKIIKAFHDASEFAPAKAIPGFESEGQKEFSALMNTTVKEQEGTARQAAFDSIAKNMRPALGDTKDTINKKLQSTIDYLASKSSAPTAKGYGIDLKKFQSTYHPEAAPQTKTVNGVTYQRGREK